jgi:hypothetical protein
MCFVCPGLSMLEPPADDVFECAPRVLLNFCVAAGLAFYSRQNVVEIGSIQLTVMCASCWFCCVLCAAGWAAWLLLRTGLAGQ